MTTNTLEPMLAMFGVSGGELLLILVSMLVMVGTIGGIIALVIGLTRRNARPIVAPPMPPPPPAAPTKHVCPQCGTQMSAGATQGLCPACLLKIGLGTETGDPGEAKRPPAAAPAPAEIAKHFSQLEILELLGQGGMGMVYKARQPQLDRFIALKILSPHLSADPAFAERFSREAKALARLNHPNIVGVFDFGKAGEFYYFLMEFVDGLNLSQMQQAKKRLAPEQALAIVPKICDALQYAHDEGVVHRDIKPGNILVDRKGRVKIADFGLAKLAGKEREDFSITQSRMTLGTPQYMAPEQFEDPQKVDHRADIYSLGVVFYEMLTGELPMGRFAPPSQRVQVDVRLDEVVLHALEREPGRRYQHASVLKTDVESIAATQPQPPPPSLMAESAEIADARRQVKGPAIGLLAAAVFNWVAIPLLGLFILPILLGAAASSTQPHPWLVFLSFATPLVPLALSAYVMYAAIKMMHLERRAGAVAAGVLAILLAPGTLIGLPAGIWALIVLNRREVREAFAKIQSRAANSRMADGAPPRFSRAAIIGAVWAIVFLPILFTVRIGPGGPQKFSVDLEMTGMSLWEWWMWLLMLWNVAWFTAPLGTTILGWISVWRIRRSAGKLRGLWLAVLDGLLFPLLALDLLIWFICEFSLRLLDPLHPLGLASANFIAYAFVMAAIISLLIDCLIIGRVWRAVNNPSQDGPAIAASADEAKAKKSRGWPFLIGVSSPLIAGAMLLTIAHFVSTKKAAEAQQAEQNQLQVAVTGNVGRQLGSRSIQYNRFTFQRLDDLPRASISFEGLRRASGTYDVSNALRGLILLRFDRPDQCDVSGTLDLADIKYSFPIATGPGRWWTETNTATGALQGAWTFGPVMERVISTDYRDSAFLNLTSGECVNAPKEMTPGQWTGEATWKRIVENQIDLMAVTDNGYPRLVLCYMESVGGLDEAWDKPARLPGAAIALLTQAPHEPRPVVRVAPGDLPATIAFNTVRGTAGLLQIVGYTEDLRGVKIRYKLLKNGAAQRKVPAPQPTGTPAFCPVIETWIPDPKAGLPSVFSFETGGFPEQPKEIGEALASHSGLDGTTLQWLRENPGDAVLAPDDALQFFEGLVYYPTINGHAASWEALTPDRVVRLVDGVEDNEESKNSVEIIASFRATLRPPAAMVFTTREKRIGVLQILGSRDNPRRVDFRYKLIQDATAREAPVAGQNQTLAFGPMFVRNLPLSDLGYSHSLNLESGVAQILPTSLTMADWSSGITLPDGIILVAPSKDRALMVAGTGTQLVPLLDSAKSWENPQWSQLNFPYELTPGKAKSVSGESSSPPVTFAFRTQKGARGLLQITGFTENPRGVTIRYKLVQRGDQSALSPMPSLQDWLALMDTGTPGGDLPLNCRD